MTIVDDLTPARYSVLDGKLVIRGTTIASMEAGLLVELRNSSGEPLDTRYIELPLSDAEKQAIISAVASKLTELESQTGIVREQ